MNHVESIYKVRRLFHLNITSILYELLKILRSSLFHKNRKKIEVMKINFTSHITRKKKERITF